MNNSIPLLTINASSNEILSMINHAAITNITKPNKVKIQMLIVNSSLKFLSK